MEILTTMVVIASIAGIVSAISAILAIEPWSKESQEFFKWSVRRTGEKEKKV